MRTILFICTGNTCRSPMAEAIAQHWIDQGLLGDAQRYLAASAGTSAFPGAPPADETVRTLASMSIETDGRSKPLQAEMIRNADVVFGMTASHVREAVALVADEEGQARKIQLLAADGDIEDPLGCGIDAYRRLADQLMELIPRRLKEVFSHEDRAGVGSSRS